MKKLIILIFVGLMIPVTTEVCRADYKDIPEQTPDTLEVWFGGHGSDQSTSKNASDARTTSLPEEAFRVPGNKAAEYYSLENSPSGGILYKSADLPNRLHIEFDFYDVDDWYGDFRYSYLDYVQIRLLPRRFYHNLDNLMLYDWSGGWVHPPIVPPTGVPLYETNINDLGVDDYGLTIDIDEYKLRVKPIPGFPLHVFSNGEYILKEGEKQLRFPGGDVYHGDVNRNSMLVKVDQEKQEYSLGANAHLGPIEIEGSRKWRNFESNTNAPTYQYGWIETAGVGDTAYQAHNVIPELEATTDTFKIHTSHSGRFFASGTYSKVEKTNEDTTAEASNEMSYGEVVWLPAGFISFTAKYRHQENEVEKTPATVSAYSAGHGPAGALDTRSSYAVEPGVESSIETASLAMRYSLIPRTSVRLKYTKKTKEVEEDSAQTWSQPLETRKEIYELNLTNWAIPKTRFTAKLKHTRNNFKFIPYIPFFLPFSYQTSVNNVPDRVNQGNLGLAVTVSPKVSLFLSGNLVYEDGKRMRQHGFEDLNLHAEATLQTYVASLAYMVNEKLSFSPTYTYISVEQDRDLLWEDATPTLYIDETYNNEQIAHNVALTMMYEPTERLDINASIDYTTTEGTYNSTYQNSNFVPHFGPPTFTFVAADVTEMQASETEEINLRLDTHYDLGNSWGVGVDLRVTDWKDTSFDNPYDGTYIGGMLKITKKIM